MTLISAYTSPGVTVTQSNTPSVANVVPTPNAIAIVGIGQGFQSSVEKVILSGLNPYVLNHTGAISSSAVVTDLTTNLVVGAGNYFIFQSANPSSIVGDEVYTFVPIYPPAPTGSFLATPSGVVSASLNGVYQYAVSYVTPSGVTGETGISTTFTPQTTLTANQGGFVSGIPTGATGTTARNIYRSKVTGSVNGPFTLVGTVAGNVTTTFGPDIVSDATAATAALPPNGVTSGDSVQIAYNYTDQNYYMPTTFDNFKDVVDKYGAPFASDGTINSQLTFAIRMAMLNGATEVIGLAYQANNLVTALPNLFSVPNLAFVSVVSGNSSDHATLQAHCTTAQTTYNLFRQCVVGQDSSAQTITAQSLRSSAQSFNDPNVILISPSSFNITNPVSLKNYAIGAQYAASAVLGMFAARDPIIPLTRKTVAGFVSPNETRSISDAALDSAAGLLNIQYNGTVFSVRHGVTTAIGSVNTAECSVVRAKYVLAFELENSLQALVGIVVPSTEAPLVVASYVNTLLNQLVSSGLLSSYDSLSARLLNNPTTVEVAFEYTPIYPINNINVVFTINTQNGGFTLSQT